MGEKGSKDAVPTNKQLGELSQQTSFTKEEIQALIKEFKEVDKDKSGELDKTEFKTVFKKRLPGCQDSYYDNLFNVFDSDKSGSISFKELITSLACISKGSTPEKLGMLFDLYDEDHSGHLTGGEIKKLTDGMKAVAKAMGQNNVDGFIEALVKKIDKDGSGTISRDEWVNEGTKTPTLLRFSSFAKS